MRTEADAASGCPVSSAEYSTEQLLTGIERALAARDFDAVAAILRLLAVRDPHAAQAVLDVVALAGERL